MSHLDEDCDPIFSEENYVWVCGTCGSTSQSPTCRPGPGCSHVGPIESLAPAEPNKHRCRKCYGRVWPEREAATPPPLDVERLAQAMRNEAQTVYYGTDEPVDWHEEATNIAAEYARLSEEHA